MYYETDFLLLLPYMRILVHALYFLSLHSDPLTLLPSCLTPAPRARKLRYHQLIAGWSSACKALDESESWSVLWKAVCCQIVLNSGTCPHPISSPRFEDIPPPPPFLSLLYGRNSRALCCSFFPCSKGAQSWRTLPCPTSFVGNAAVLVREKSSLDCWRLLAGVAEFIFFVCCKNWRPKTDGFFSSLRESLESLHISLGSRTSALLAILWNRLFPSQKMGSCLQRTWKTLLILHIFSEWQCGSHSFKTSSLY